jgi:hypothetical protein
VIEAHIEELRRARQNLEQTWTEAAGHWRDEARRRYEGRAHAEVTQALDRFLRACADLDETLEVAERVVAA